MRNILLDTNSYSLFVKNEASIVKEVKKSDLIFISAVSIGELYFGFHKGSRFEKNREILEKFVKNSHVRVVKISYETAKIYAQIFLELKELGYPIPSNDVWIAACAIETGSALITYDRHFLKIPGVKVWKSLH